MDNHVHWVGFQWRPPDRGRLRDTVHAFALLGPFYPRHLRPLIRHVSDHVARGTAAPAHGALPASNRQKHGGRPGCFRNCPRPAAASTLSWNEIFPDTINALVIQDAESLLSKSPKLGGGLEAGEKLFNSIIQWAEDNDLRVGNKLKWMVEGLKDTSNFNLLLAGSTLGWALSLKMALGFLEGSWLLGSLDSS